MSKILKTILIAILVAVAIVAVGMFAVYKYFVTPERVLQISLVQAGKDIKDSFNVFSEKEREVFDYIIKNGSKTELSFEIEDIPLIGGKQVSVISNTDTVCSVTEIDAGDFTLATYKDKENILINTSLFDGGFRIPTADFEKEWNDSIFKDMMEVSTQYSGKNAISDFAKGDFDVAEYATVILSVFKDITEKNPVRKNKKMSVMVGGKTKKADTYTVTVTKEDAQKLLVEVPAAYAISGGGEISSEREKQIKEYFKSFADDYEITFKIHDKKIRELEIENSAGETKTLIFKGEKNPFDTTEFYINGDNEGSIRRVHSESEGSLYEKLYVSDKLVFESENNIGDIKMHFDNDIVNISLDIYGKETNEDSIVLPDIRLNINDTINVSAECVISKYFDRDFGFEKTGQYVNLLDISQEEWDIIFDSLFGKE